jgi:hypothetical protein
MWKGQKDRWNSFQPDVHDLNQNNGTIARAKECTCRSTEEVASLIIMLSFVVSACNHEMYPSSAP